MVVSEKAGRIFNGGSAIRKMFEDGLKLKAQFGEERVADLALGNPDFPPPAAFTEALRRTAFDPPRHAYMPNSGFADVRALIADNLSRRDLLPGVQAEHIVMTTGAAGALNVVLKTILDPGDEVIVIRPYFVEYGFYIDNHGGRMVLVDSSPDCDLDPGLIEAAITSRTRAVFVNSPNNPSGRMYSADRLHELSAVLTRASEKYGRPVFLVSDEPYREIVFDGGTFTSPAACYANSFLCYSWSKTFSISGERIGYIAVNPELQTETWPVLMGSLAMCNRVLGFVNAPAFMQRVIGAAVDATPEIGHYEAKRRLLRDALDEAGYRYVPPQGTFYLFPQTLGDEAEFVARAKEKLLLVVPGSAFGRPGHFRISYAAPEATVHLACRLLRELAQ